MKPVNIKELQTLVERYETITLNEIKDKWTKTIYSCAGQINARAITGFGSITTCILCTKTNDENYYSCNCFKCVHADNDSIRYNGYCSGDIFCKRGNNQETYEKIITATTPKQLLTAFRNRAKHLRKTYPQYLTVSS